MSGSPHWSLSPRFPHQNPVHSSPLPHPSYILRPSHSSRFCHPHNISYQVITDRKVCVVCVNIMSHQWGCVMWRF
jgi:hypothetical protein